MLVCAIALASLAVACGDNEPSTSEPAAAPVEPGAAAPAAPAPAPPVAATPDAAEEDFGDPIVTEGVIPEGFPKDVPIYPGANIGSSISGPGLGVFVTFDTDDPVDAILAHYRSELAKGGWSVVDTAGGDGLDATKEQRTVQVRARPNEEQQDRTEIAVTISKS